MISRILQKPLFHVEGMGVHRNAGWLELFYDLIFVAAFVQLGNALSNNLSVHSFLLFAGVFFALWLSWVGFSFYSVRYNIDDVFHRILVFIQMIAVAVMTVSADALISDRHHTFAVAFALALSVVVVLYGRSVAQQPIGTAYAKYWGAVFAVAAGCWLFSIWFEPPVRYLLWAVAGAAVLYAPFSKASRALQDRFPLDWHHLSERFALLTLIVLGESFIKVLSLLQGLEFSSAMIPHAVFVLTLAFVIWWVYFDDVAGNRLRATPLAFQSWLYGHLLLQMGMVVFGIGLAKFVGIPLEKPGPAGYVALLMGGLVAIMFAVGVLDSVVERRDTTVSDRSRVNFRFVTAVLFTILAIMGGKIPAMLLLTIVLMACLGQIIFDIMIAPARQIDGYDFYMKHASLVQRLGDQEAMNRLATPTMQHEKVGSRPSLKAGRPVVKDMPNDLKSDLYYFFIDASWPKVLAAISFLYVISNTFFALLYMAQPGSITGADGTGSFFSAFSFSVQTMSTIGFGVLSPGSAYGDILVVLEAAFGIIGVSLITGLMFAKISRAKAKIIFSNQMLVTKWDGQPYLCFRAGNVRGNDIIDAGISVSALKETYSSEGQHLRRVVDLKLTRDRTPFFSLSWTLMHPLDDDSPLRDLRDGIVPDDLMAITVVMVGHDGTYGQTVYERKIYEPEDLVFERRFVDVIETLPDGRFMLDFSKFHLTVDLPQP